MKVVVDTNVLLVCVSPRSNANWLWQSILQGTFEICITTDILNEYAEIIGREMGLEASEIALDILTDLPNVHFIQKYFAWNLIEADPDDNKFIDCAIAAGAKYLVSEDKHFKILRQFPYFQIEVVSLENFKSILSE
jgi:uncharacterized protein